MLKHDFTTYDLLGQWGMTMKSRPHALRQSFRDGSRTTAEITLDLYRTIAEASGQADHHRLQHVQPSVRGLCSSICGRRRHERQSGRARATWA